MNVDELREKTEEYQEYVKEHQRNVLKAWLELTELIDLNSVYPGLYDEVERRVKDHDYTKLWDEEFYGYRNHFYPCDGERRNEEAWARAWEHHWKCNDHHWQYWVEIDEDKREPEVPLRVMGAYTEMILDWQAMGYKFGGTALDWYRKNSQEIKLLPNWEPFVVNMLETLYG